METKAHPTHYNGYRPARAFWGVAHRFASMRVLRTAAAAVAHRLPIQLLSLPKVRRDVDLLVLQDRRVIPAPAGIALLVGLAGCADQAASPTSSLAATCSATPASGVAPLAVSFGLRVEGSTSYDVALDFGDGTRSVEGFFTPSTSLTLPHVYQAPGRYAAKFLVSGAGGQSVACSVGVGVNAPDPTASAIAIRTPDER